MDERHHWPASGFGLNDPPKPSAPLQQRRLRVPEESVGMAYFLQALEAALKTRPSSKEDGPRAHILSAILQVDFSRYCRECSLLNGLFRQDWNTVRDEVRRQDEVRLWQRLKRLDAAVHSTIDGAQALLDDIPDLPRDDVQAKFVQLRRLQTHVQRIAEEVKDSSNGDIKLQSLRMSQMNINESRSGIARRPKRFHAKPWTMLTLCQSHSSHSSLSR